MVVGNLGTSFNEVFKSLWNFTIRNEQGKHPILPFTSPGHECSPELQASSHLKYRLADKRSFLWRCGRRVSPGAAPHRSINVADKLLEWSFQAEKACPLRPAQNCHHRQDPGQRSLWLRGHLPDSLQAWWIGLEGWQADGWKRKLALKRGITGIDPPNYALIW